MAELLVRVVDKAPPSTSRRGDVIAVQPDGWPWGRMEMANPDWRLVKLPHVSVEDARNALLEPGRRSSPTQERGLVPRRAFRLEIEAGEPVTLPWTLDDVVAARKQAG